jgi:hypothetical protein
MVSIMHGKPAAGFGTQAALDIEKYLREKSS